MHPNQIIHGGIVLPSLALFMYCTDVTKFCSPIAKRFEIPWILRVMRWNGYHCGEEASRRVDQQDVFFSSSSLLYCCHCGHWSWHRRHHYHHHHHYNYKENIPRQRHHGPPSLVVMTVLRADIAIVSLWFLCFWILLAKLKNIRRSEGGVWVYNSFHLYVAIYNIVSIAIE